MENNLPPAVRQSLDEALTLTLKEYYYLKGDNCQKSRSFLLGFCESEFRRTWGRGFIDPEETYATDNINAFLEPEGCLR